MKKKNKKREMIKEEDKGKNIKKMKTNEKDER